MPPIPPLPQPLSDDTVGLRFTAERDIPEILIAYQDDPQLHIRLGRRRPPSGAQLGQQLEVADAERAQGTRASLAILELPSDECRGEITIQEIDWYRMQASVGIWVAPGARNQGLGRRALRLVARWLFDAAGLKRIVLLTDVDNAPMLRAARAAGFLEEGVVGSEGRERCIGEDMALLLLQPRDLRSPEATMGAGRSPEPRA